MRGSPRIRWIEKIGKDVEIKTMSRKHIIHIWNISQEQKQRAHHKNTKLQRLLE